MEFKMADSSIKEQLIELTIDCFNESEDLTRDFFERMANSDNYFTVFEDGKPVSGLCAIPCEMIVKDRVVSGSYIYSACTHTEYRNRGYMSLLINHVNDKLKERGVKFSVLVPANRKLRMYYNKIGYRDFFKSRTVDFSSQEMEFYGRFIIEGDYKKSYSQMHEMRSKIYNNNLDIIWSQKCLEYADSMNKVGYGDTVFIDDGYAICYVSKSKKVNCVDFTADDDDIFNLLGAMYKMFGDTKGYNIRIPCKVNLFAGRGKIKDFGMIKILDDINGISKTEFIEKYRKREPFIGLAFD